MSNTKKEILYVAYRDEPLEEGISYALYLSGLMGAELRIVLLGRNGLGAKFDDSMVAVTFAEANEHETARRILNGEDDAEDAASIQRHLSERCGAEGIRASIHVGLEATVSVVKEFLRRKKIALVLLSPEMTVSRNVFNGLIRKSPRPVVTMARGAVNGKMAVKGGVS